MTPWKAALLLIPCSFCIWAAYLTVSIAGSRRQVHNGIAIATHFSVMDDLLRNEANPLDGGPTPAAVQNSWPAIRAQFDSAQRILEANAPLSQALEPYVDQLRVTAKALDTLSKSLATKRAAGATRDAPLSRVRVLNARAADLLAATRERLRAQLTTLLVDAGHRWRDLALIVVVSIVLAIATTLLFFAYGRALGESKRLTIDLRQSLAEVKHLQGILPICAYCKRVRDDTDAWQQIEHYVSQRTEATFSHGICPSCYTAHVVPDLDRFVPDGPDAE